MVKQATALGRSGLQDWLIQRVSAVILALYTIFISTRIFGNSLHSYLAWRDLFASGWVKTATIFALLSLIAHAWIGMWTMTTDYLKPVVIRLPVQVLMILALVLYFIWGIHIIGEI